MKRSTLRGLNFHNHNDGTNTAKYIVDRLNVIKRRVRLSHAASLLVSTKMHRQQHQIFTIITDVLDFFNKISNIWIQPKSISCYIFHFYLRKSSQSYNKCSAGSFFHMVLKLFRVCAALKIICQFTKHLFHQHLIVTYSYFGSSEWNIECIM